TDQNTAQAFTVPVLLENGIANVELSNQEYSYTHYLKFIGGPPRPPKRKKEEQEQLPPFLDSLQNALADSLLQQDSLLQKDSLFLKNLDSLKQQLIADSSFQTLDSLMGPKDSLILPEQLDSLTTDSLPSPKGAPKKGAKTSGKNQKSGQSPFYTQSAPNTTELPPQAIGPPKRAVTLAHQISYKRSIYRFSDTSPDTSFYGDFAVHRIGLRHFINHKRLENNFRLSTFKARSNRTDLQKSQQDLLEVGLSHTLHLIDQEAENSTVSNLFLTGRWHFSPSERLSARTYAHLGFWDNGGDYRVSGDFYFDFKKGGKLRLGIMSQRFAPSLVQQRIFISGIPFWDNDFSKTFETTVSGSYQLPLLKLEIRGQYHLVNNYIYFDSSAMPQQTGEAISIAQLMLKKNFKVWRFHLENTFILQQNSSQVLRLPKYYLVNSLYYEGFLFKKVFLARFGADFRLNGSFQANRYQALTGQFYLQNDLTAIAYPSLDVFINFKVERFRFFAKWENVLDQAIGDLFYLTALYPQRFFGFRFGISWRFRN
ncbi:MAG: putative porin, partial [Bacteroidota bacterium]